VFVLLQQGKQFAHQMFMLRGALNRMRNRLLSMAWEKWQQWYADLMEQKRFMAGALRRMLHRQLSMAWERWQEWYESVKQQQHIMQGALHRMLRRQLSMAWEKWQEWYTQHVQMLYQMEGAVRRMLNRKLSQGWEQWQYWYAEYIRQQILLQRGIQRLRQAKLAAALTTWRIVAEYLIRLMEKMGRRWRNRAIFTAFGTWYRKLAYPEPEPPKPKPVPHFEVTGLPPPAQPPSNHTPLLYTDRCLVSQFHPSTSPQHPGHMNTYARSDSTTIRTYPDASLCLRQDPTRRPRG